MGQQSGDFDIVKHRVSPFYSTSLEAILRANGIRRIYGSCVSTNAVVQATVREGHDRDYEMVVLEDACCGLSTDEHESAIKSLQRFCRGRKRCKKQKECAVDAGSLMHDADRPRSGSESVPMRACAVPKLACFLINEPMFRLQK